MQRIKTFGEIILSSLPQHTSSTGASALMFTPDSQKLILSTFAVSNAIVVELPTGSDLKSAVPKVVHVFTSAENGRDLLKKVDEDVEVEVEMKDSSLHRKNSSSCTLNLAVSRDAQWLAFSDSTRRVSVCNLDTLQVS